MKRAPYEAHFRCSEDLGERQKQIDTLNSTPTLGHVRQAGTMHELGFDGSYADNSLAAHCRRCISSIPTKRLGKRLSCCCLHAHRKVPSAPRTLTTTAERIQDHLLGKSSSSMRPSKRAAILLADGLDLGSLRHISRMICVKVRGARRGTGFRGYVRVSNVGIRPSTQIFRDLPRAPKVAYKYYKQKIECKVTHYR